MRQTPRVRRMKRKSKSTTKSESKKRRSTKNRSLKPRALKETKSAEVIGSKKKKRSRELPSALAASNSECLSVVARTEKPKKKERKKRKDAQRQKKTKKHASRRVLSVDAPRPASPPVPRNCVKVSRYQVGPTKHTELRFVSYNRVTQDGAVERPLNLCDLLAEVVSDANGSFTNSKGLPASPILSVYLNMARISALKKLNDQLKRETSYLEQVNTYLQNTIETKKNVEKSRKEKNEFLYEVTEGLTRLADEKIECDAATGHLREGIELYDLVRQMNGMKLEGKTKMEQREILQHVTKIRHTIKTALEGAQRLS